MTLLRTAIVVCIGLLGVLPFVYGQIFAQRPDPMRAISVTFALGDTITFNLSSKTAIVESMEVRVLGKMYSVPLTNCAPLKNVRFETLDFLLGEQDNRNAGTFSFIFRAGAERDRRYGELPMIKMGFFRGKLVDPTVTTKTGAHAYYSSPLCFRTSMQVPR